MSIGSPHFLLALKCQWAPCLASQCFGFLPSKVDIITLSHRVVRVDMYMCSMLLAHSGHTGNGCYVSGSCYKFPTPGVQQTKGRGLGPEDFQGRKGGIGAGI